MTTPLTADRVPWYVIAWRFPWWCLAWLFRWLFLIAIFFGYGIDKAIDEWRLW